MERWIEFTTPCGQTKFFNLAQSTYFRVWGSTKRDTEEKTWRVNAFLTSLCGDSDGFSPDDIFLGQYPTEDMARRIIRDIINGEYDVRLNVEVPPVEASATVEDVLDKGDIPF